jgi:hypothetical protein
VSKQEHQEPSAWGHIRFILRVLVEGLVVVVLVLLGCLVASALPAWLYSYLVGTPFLETLPTGFALAVLLVCLTPLVTSYVDNRRLKALLRRMRCVSCGASEWSSDWIRAERGSPVRRRCARCGTWSADAPER